MKSLKLLIALLMCVCLMGLSYLPLKSFVEAKQKEPVLTIGLMTDVQYCDCDPRKVFKIVWSDRHYRKSLKKLDEAVQTFNEKDVDFTMNAGDSIDHDIDSYKPVIKRYDKLNKPLYNVLGNHDFPNHNLDALKPLKMERDYYSFSKKGYRFIFLNTNEISTYATKAGTKEYDEAIHMLSGLQQQHKIFAEHYNGALSQKQLSWFETELKRAKKLGEKVIITAHHPVFPVKEDNAWNADQVLKLMDKYNNVVAYFNGHSHEGYYHVRNGVHHMNLKGMLETKNKNSFAVLKIYKNQMFLDGYGREKDRILKIKKVYKK